MRKTKKIWIDGRWRRWDKAQIHLLSHGLHYGSAVFEGIRCYQTDQGLAVFRLNDHLKRLFFSARSLGLNSPYPLAQLSKGVVEAVKINRLQEGYIRPIIFAGYGKMGLSLAGIPVHTAIAVWPWGAYLDQTKGLKVKIVSQIRFHPQSVTINAKISGYYAAAVAISTRVQRQKYDEALLLDSQGAIAEGPGENIFFVKDKEIFTPTTENILPGITRDSVMKMAKSLNLKITEKKIFPEEIGGFEEAFFTGTAVEICPIGRINQWKIGGGRPGPITKQLSQTYSRMVRGKEQRYHRWLTWAK